MAELTGIVLNEIAVLGIDLIAAALSLIALAYAYRMFANTKKATDIWLLISFAVFALFLVNLFNAVERYPYVASVFSEIEPYIYKPLDILGEYLNLIFFITWIYIAYRFILFGRLE